jgi:hypothetical protein
MSYKSITLRYNNFKPGKKTKPNYFIKKYLGDKIPIEIISRNGRITKRTAHINIYKPVYSAHEVRFTRLRDLIFLTMHKEVSK